MQVIKDLFASKKFVASLVGLVSAVAFRLGVPETELTELLAVISPILVYIGAQGFADQGKEAVKIEMDG